MMTNCLIVIFHYIPLLISVMENWCCVCWASTQLTNLIYVRGELVDSQSVSQTDKQKDT